MRRSRQKLPCYITLYNTANYPLLAMVTLVLPAILACACALQGCGLVTMGSHEEAVAAIQGLDNKYTWEGMDSTMVVKWMDVAMQRRRREQHLAAVRQGLVPNFAVSECEGGHLGTQAGKGLC